MRDVYIFDGEKTLELDGKVQARFSLKNISVGDEIIFSADVYPIALLSDGVQSYLIKNGVFYSCENVTGVSRSVGYATVPERVRDFVRQSMTENMSEVSSSVAVGLLIGDKAFMDDCLADAYKRTGVATYSRSAACTSVLLRVYLPLLSENCVSKAYYPFL